MILFLLLWLVSLNSAAISQSFPSSNVSPAFARLRNGTLMGRRLNFRQFNCDVYLGIPYARPPIGALRFKLPQSPISWGGVAFAGSYSSVCVQPTGNDHLFNAATNVSEDCLFLNVFVPAPVAGKITQPHAVMVWIHGGGFYYGSASSLQPEDVCISMTSKDIVVVTINYRLGPFGFAHWPQDSASMANLGLYDQIQALRWVKENIGAFGGDPSRVTVVGHGSGAACVSLLSITPLAKDLFHQAVQMSGSSLSSWAVTSNSLHSTKSLLEAIGCSGNGRSPESATQCLRNKDAMEILHKAPYLWSPTVDGPNSVIPELPRDVLLNKGFNPTIPTIMGFTRDEAALLFYKKLASKNVILNMNTFEKQLLPEFINSFLDSMSPLQEAVKFQYFSLVPRDNLYAYIQSVIDLYSDYLFKAPLLYEAILRSENQNSLVYLYSYEEAVALDNLLPGWKATPHGSDLISLWGWRSAANITKEISIAPGANWHASSVVANLWADFIKYGKVPAVTGVRPAWTPFRAKLKALLKVTGTPRISSVEEDPRLQFWSSFVPQLLKAQETKSDKPLPNASLKPHSPSTPTATISSTTSWASSQQTPKTSTFSMIPSTNNHRQRTWNHNNNNNNNFNGNRSFSTSNAAVDRFSMVRNQTTTTTTKQFGIMNAWPLRSTSATTPQLKTTIAATPVAKSVTKSTSTTAMPQALNSSTEIPKHSSEETTTIMWVMVALALLFFVMFLVTAGACAVWNKQTYYTRSPRRTAKQNHRLKHSAEPIPAAAPPQQQATRPQHNSTSRNYPSTPNRPPQLPPRPPPGPIPAATISNNNSGRSRR